MIRPISIWGPWFDTRIIIFFKAVARGLYLHPREHLIRRNYGFVLNAVHQIDQLVAKWPAELFGRTFYLADYVPIEIKIWADLIHQGLNVRSASEIPFFAEVGYNIGRFFKVD
jgi:hypothetical protein